MRNILIIGCGYHARRIYVPHLMEQNKVKLSAIVDLASQRDIIEKYLSDKAIYGVEMLYTDNYEISDVLSKMETAQLDALVERNNISGVIISTEPLAHFKYAVWALKKGLHILMDKPITTELDVSTNKKRAKKLYDDYLILKDLYLRQIKNGYF